MSMGEYLGSSNTLGTKTETWLRVCELLTSQESKERNDRRVDQKYSGRVLIYQYEDRI